MAAAEGAVAGRAAAGRVVRSRQPRPVSGRADRLLARTRSAACPSTRRREWNVGGARDSFGARAGTRGWRAAPASPRACCGTGPGGGGARSRSLHRRRGSSCRRRAARRGKRGRAGAAGARWSSAGGRRPILSIRRVVEYLRSRPAKGPDDLAVAALSGDASTRRYFRLGDDGRNLDPGALPRAFRQRRPAVSGGQGLLARWGLPVPARPRPGTGPAESSCRRTWGTRPCRTPCRVARGAGGTSCTARPWPARAAAAGGGARAAGAAAASSRLRHREAHVGAALLPEAFRGGPPRQRAGGGGPRQLAEAFHRLAEEIASWPRVLCHRDFHSRNLMLHGGGAPLDRFPGREDGPGHLRPGVAPARFLRRAPRGLRGGAGRGVPAERAAPGGPRHLPAPLRADVDPAEPEGAGHLRLHGRRRGKRRSTSNTCREPSRCARSALARRPELAGIHSASWRTISRSWLDGYRSDRGFRDHVGEEVLVRGLAPQQALERQAPVPHRARRQRVLAGRDGQGRGSASRPGPPPRRPGRNRASSSRARSRRTSAPRGATRSTSPACGSSRPSTTTRSRPRSTARRS